MVKKRVIKFFTFLFLFAICLVLIQTMLFGKIYILKGSPLESENFKEPELPTAKTSIMTSFAIAEEGGADFSMFTIIILSGILFIIVIKFIYSHDKRIKNEFISSRTDRGLIKLDLP
ncbi:MAG: hypothetical protein Q8Q31_01005 [Nanoarchaeota archaeon]|nr:hypothetical protein [Nanoarchaeota archaeon]